MRQVAHARRYCNYIQMNPEVQVVMTTGASSAASTSACANLETSAGAATDTGGSASARGSCPPLAFVDLETTGLSPGRHRILEIGIVTVDGERVNEWSTLVNPRRQVPAFTRSFTGISDAMIADAPRFEDIAPEIEQRLRGRLFIAHNARFDHGFLRSELARVGIDFRPDVLCTVRLSRKLFPQFARHDLDTLMARHDLVASTRHRALADAQLIWQFWQSVHGTLPATEVTRAVGALLAAPKLPAAIDGIVQDLPELPGAYVLYDERGAPVFVGSAGNLRRRGVAQLRTDAGSKRAHALAGKVADIEWHATSGLLGARLKAAALAEATFPAAARSHQGGGALCSWRLTPDAEVLITELAWMRASSLGSQDLFGLYTSERKATNALRKLARAHGLCYSLLGVKHPPTDRPHLACRAGDCSGGCGRSEARRLQIARFIAAAARVRIKPWPYEGAIGIREGRELHLVDDWRYLGTARNEHEIAAVLESRPPPFDAQIFRILAKWLPNCPRRSIAVLDADKRERSARDGIDLAFSPA